MLVLVTLVCVGFDYWVHWSKEWIRQRQEFFAGKAYPVSRMNRDDSTTRAPFGFGLFGEDGMELVYVETEGQEQEAARLFPEATICLFRIESLPYVESSRPLSPPEESSSAR